MQFQWRWLFSIILYIKSFQETDGIWSISANAAANTFKWWLFIVAMLSSWIIVIFREWSMSFRFAFTTDYLFIDVLQSSYLDPTLILNGSYFSNLPQIGIQINLYYLGLNCFLFQGFWRLERWSRDYTK